MNKKTLIKEYIKDNVLDMEEIMKEFTNYIYTIIVNRSSCFQPEDIEEIISDVYLVLWSNQEKLNQEKSLSPYIAGITKNLITKKYRGVVNNENIEDYEEKLIAKERFDVLIENQEKNEKLLKELNKLKKEDQEIFILFYYKFKKIKEISIILGISENKVKSRLSRLRKKLNKKIKEEM